MWKYWGAALALGTAAIPATAAAQAATPAEFHAGGINFTMPLPKGYCLPSAGASQSVAQLISAADSENLTLLVLFDCTGTPGVDADYLVIKIPKPALMVEVTREQVIREVSAAVGTTEFKAATAPDKINTDTAKSIGDVLNTEVKIDSAFAPSGHDDFCVYMQGIIVMGVAGKQVKVAAAGCVTGIGGRILTIYRYGDGNVPGRVEALVPEVRALAESIAVKPVR
ncbi:hypothetical protein [Sphingomonas sp. G-3-2-10]|uniref:hypothetical protein n=1 Tax=Sphingomonas sp. G-3-2-10 TaxID=2728838 RepID=UPI00146C1B06|nr:hypothetical protein [Sphingomonas sp. G-3-2-10]NML07484.1 hypothetical protein [Sphingomonas sp. G-3-2-10]